MATTHPTKRIYLRIFKPRGRRCYEETFDDPAKADAREAQVRGWGWLVTRSERDVAVPFAKQPKAQRERKTKLREKQAAVRKVLDAKRKAARWAAIHALADGLKADGRIDATTAVRRARKLWPSGEVRAEVVMSVRRSTAGEPVCRVTAGHIEGVGNLFAYFLVEHLIEAPTFEDALDQLAAKVKGA